MASMILVGKIHM